MKIIYNREDFPEPGDRYIYEGIQKLNTRDYHHALKNFEKAAIYDNADGLIFVAVFNLMMLGTSRRNVTKALDCLKKADSIGGNPVAQYLIGMLYFEGDGGITPNFERALEWLTLAANNGWSDAMGHLAYAYHIGKYVNHDQEKAIYWLNQINEKDIDENIPIKNDKVCLFGCDKFEIDQITLDENMQTIVAETSTKRLASFPVHTAIQISFRETDSDECLIHHAFWWDTLSNRNSNCVAASQLLQAKLFEKKTKYYEKETNEKMAQLYYKKAAKNGNSDACFKIGIGYNNGIGVKRSYKKALLWYQRSKNLGALFNTGLIYYYGRAIKRDHQEALANFSAFNRKAKQKDAFKYMASIYATGGYGVEKNIETAIDLYTKAVENGCGDSAMEIGMIFLEGKSYEKAYEWFLKGRCMNSTKYFAMISQMIWYRDTAV